MSYEKQFDFLKRKFESGKLGHAYVFSGKDMESLKKFCKELVKLLNKDFAPAAQLIEKGSFPDLLVLKSENSKSSLKDGEDKQEVDISLIREAQNFLSYKPYCGTYKTVIIENAERMNTDAADCFLKNLEEPRGHALIILLCSKPEMLLPTIASRCQVIQFPGVPQVAPLPQQLQNVLGADLAERFLYAKSANLEGGAFEHILQMLQNYWRKDITKHRKVLKLALDLERKMRVSNLNKKLALEILLLEA